MDQNLPRISIVTPSYNQGQYLERTIISVLEQDYPDLEYVIIDGCSTDNSVETIKGYEESLTYWVSEPDCGQSDALNKGFAKCSGQVLGWLCSDDTLEPGALLRVGAFFRDHPEADVVHGDANLIDENDAIIDQVKGVKFSKRALMYGSINLPQSSILWLRQLHARVGELDIDLNYAMDTDLWIRFVQAGARFVYLPGCLSNQRLHSGSKLVKETGATTTAGRTLRQRAFGVRNGSVAYTFWRAIYGMRRAAFYIAQGDGAYLARKLVKRLR